MPSWDPGSNLTLTLCLTTSNTVISLHVFENRQNICTIAVTWEVSPWLHIAPSKRGMANVMRQSCSLLPPWLSRHWDWQPDWNCLERWFHSWHGLPGPSHHGEMEDRKAQTWLFNKALRPSPVDVPDIMCFTDKSFAAYLQEKMLKGVGITIHWKEKYASSSMQYRCG